VQISFAIKLSKSDNWKWVKTKISFVRGKSGHLGSVQYLDETIAFTITLRQKPRGVSRNRRIITKKRKPVLRGLSEIFLDFCLRVIMHKFHPYLEKTTSSVLSVLLFNLWKLWTWIYNKYLTTLIKGTVVIVSYEGS